MLEYLFLAGLSRFLIEFLRLNPEYAMGLSGGSIYILIYDFNIFIFYVYFLERR